MRARQLAGRDDGPSQATELHRSEAEAAAPVRIALPKSNLGPSASSAPAVKPSAIFQDDGRENGEPLGLKDR